MLDVDRIACQLAPGSARPTLACIRPPAATGACSADMMLEALVACAGMTVSAVATAMRKAPGRAGC